MKDIWKKYLFIPKQRKLRRSQIKFLYTKYEDVLNVPKKLRRSQIKFLYTQFEDVLNVLRKLKRSQIKFLYTQFEDLLNLGTTLYIYLIE